ncbi:general transcription factor 3C polypeptide 3-like [Schistocerca gregaria]|uniref:general transcription factor 3C polypeptide 3-like n=1 Tax=Schistocerca gregaria TaxID=7010 RepID=UPI00211F410F|nr:general transcription factor 3C polypeptide 3-like [Schistocerca gregaria]
MDWTDDRLEEMDEEEEEEMLDAYLIPKDVQHELFGPSLDDYLETSGACQPKRARSKNKIPPHVAKLMGEANILYAQGDHEAAKEVLQLVISNNANIPSPYHTLGLICEERGEISDAAQFYMLAAELSGKNPALWKRTGAMFVQVNDYERAITCYGRAIKQDPKDFESVYQKAMVYEEMGELKQAASEFCHLLEKAPSVLDAYKELGRIYYTLGEMQQAAGVLKQGYTVMTEGHSASQRNEEVDFDLINMYAECKMNSGEWREALEVIDYAESRRGLGPLLLQLNVKRAICNTYLGNTTDARAHINYLLDQPVEQWHDLYLEMAECLVACMDFSQALLFFDSLLQVKEYNGVALWMQIVHCYHSMGNIEKAIQFCERAFESDKTNVDVCLTLSGLFHQAGSPEKGIQVVEEHDACLKNKSAVEEGAPKARGLAEPETGHQPNFSLRDEHCTEPDFQDREKELRILLQKARLMYARKNYEEFTDILTEIFQDRSLLFFRQRRRITRRIFPNETTKWIPTAKRHKSKAFKRPSGAGIEEGENSEANQPPAKDKLCSNMLPDFENSEHPASPLESEWPRPVADDVAENNATTYDMSVRKNIWELVGMSAFAQILMDYGKCLIYLQRANKDTFLLIKTLYDLILEEVAFIEVTDHVAKELRFVVAKTAYASGMYDTSTSLMRQICASYPNHQSVWNFFYKATSKSKKFFLSRGFVLRLLNKHPSCVPLLLLSGHMSQMAGSHRMALTSYISAYALQPKQPLILLSTGVAFLNLSTSRKNPNRHETVMKAFAFLYSYFIEQVYGTGNGTHEANYNLARAFHHLQLYNFAIPLYNLVLSDSKPAVDFVSESHGIIGHLKREAAYNLSLIYRSCGAHVMARKCLQDYLTI